MRSGLLTLKLDGCETFSVNYLKIILILTLYNKKWLHKKIGET